MKRTVKEIRPELKKEVDNFILAMLEKYPEIMNSVSLQESMKDEIGFALNEIKLNNKILTNKERWG